MQAIDKPQSSHEVSHGAYIYHTFFIEQSFFRFTCSKFSVFRSLNITVLAKKTLICSTKLYENYLLAEENVRAYSLENVYFFVIFLTNSYFFEKYKTVMRNGENVRKK